MEGLWTHCTDSSSTEKRILESRFDGSQFLPWQVMDQELENERSAHVSLKVAPTAIHIQCSRN